MRFKDLNSFQMILLTAATCGLGLPSFAEANTSNVLWGEVAKAHSADEEHIIPDPVPYLLEEIRLFNEIEPYLTRYDVPRLQMLKLYTNRVVLALRDERYGIGHKETFEAFMDQIGALDGAESYFAQIENDFIRVRTTRIRAIQTELASTYGFKKTSYTTNLLRMIQQMKTLIDEMSAHPIPLDLSQKLKSLIPQLGFASAAAATGDRPVAFEKVKPITQSVTALYESFNRLSDSKDVFNTALMIQLINERLIDYGQYEQDGQ